MLESHFFSYQIFDLSSAFVQKFSHYSG